MIYISGQQFSNPTKTKDVIRLLSVPNTQKM